ncbi:MAG: LamG-like jellyroll fold domain-containing protein [Planctomycetota bacterium]
MALSTQALASKLALVSTLAYAISASAIAQVFPPGATRWSGDGYVEYIVGNAPILVTAGHGGDLMPPTIPDRTYGTFAHDTRTLELARELATSLRSRFDLHPHVVLFHLHRRKVDVNREVVEGAQGDPNGVAAYDAFHRACSDARAAIGSGWGAGIYLDLHGHGHPENWIELGYSLSAAQLALPDSTLAQPNYVVQSTIRSVGSLPGVTFPEVLRGASSLGGFLQSGGYDSVPGPNFPDPNGGNYFSGGHNVQIYGSRGGGSVDGIQMETPISVRRTVLVRAPFLSRVGGWIESFLPRYRGLNPAAGARVTIVARDRVASETGGRGEILVRRTGSLTSTRVIPLAYAGTATMGSDYAPLPLFVTLAPNESEVHLEVRGLDDAAIEGDETVEVWIAAGNDVGAQSRARVVIHDDEAQSDVALQLPLDAVGAGGAITDVSGNQRHGAALPIGAGPTLIAGVRGSALRFDGSDDRVRVSDFPHARGAELTLAFWFRTSATSSTGFRYLVSHGAVATAHRLGVYFDQSTGHLRTALIHANDLTDLDVLDVTRDLRDGQWHHYALVATASRLVRVHIDGVEETASQFLGDVLDPVGDFVLGARSDVALSTFAAVDIDEVQLWSRALSSVEVELLRLGAGREWPVYPGSTQALVLTTGVDGVATGGPRLDVKSASGGSTVTASYAATEPSLVGRFGVVMADVFLTGLPPMHPIFPELHVGGAALVVDGPTRIGSAVPDLRFTVPPGLSGISLMLQPVALTELAGNGFFLAGDAHEVRFR